MASKVATQLAAALHDRALVRFIRPFEKGSVHGYVKAVGRRFFAVALVSEGIRFNGFQCFRLSDVRELRVPNPRADFIEKVLKLRGERMPKKPPVKLDTLESLLATADRCFPLITIHLDAADPHVCYIGHIESIAKGRVRLLEIDPSGVWDAEPSEYRLSEITRVDFGGDYEEALFLVGGVPASK